LLVRQQQVASCSSIAGNGFACAVAFCTVLYVADECRMWWRKRTGMILKKAGFVLEKLFIISA
jgi:hypothetical protein